MGGRLPFLPRPPFRDIVLIHILRDVLGHQKLGKRSQQTHVIDSLGSDPIFRKSESIQTHRTQSIGPPRRTSHRPTGMAQFSAEICLTIVSKHQSFQHPRKQAPPFLGCTSSQQAGSPFLGLFSPRKEPGSAFCGESKAPFKYTSALSCARLMLGAEACHHTVVTSRKPLDLRMERWAKTGALKFPSKMEPLPYIWVDRTQPDCGCGL